MPEALATLLHALFAQRAWAKSHGKRCAKPLKGMFFGMAPEAEESQ
ncbi:MAG: hypothetical protein K6G15_04380 [Desulfovibrio sp.]|nr:hypothetical protein [Desulfovibrio sp.]